MSLCSTEYGVIIGVDGEAGVDKQGADKTAAARLARWSSFQ